MPRGDFGFGVAIRGNMDGFLKDLGEAVPRARTQAVRSTAAKVTRFYRKAIVDAGLGSTGNRKFSIIGQQKATNARLEKAIRQVNEPRQGISVSPRSVVISKAIVNRPGGKVDLVTVFQEGATIRATGGKSLYTRRTAQRGGPLLNLGQQVTIRRRLHLTEKTAQLLASLSDVEARELEKLAVRAARKAAR